MTLKQTAIWNVAKILGLALITGALLGIGVVYLGPATVGTISGVALMLYVIHLCYVVELDRLERLDTLNKIREEK